MLLYDKQWSIQKSALSFIINRIAVLRTDIAMLLLSLLMQLLTKCVAIILHWILYCFSRTILFLPQWKLKSVSDHCVTELTRRRGGKNHIPSLEMISFYKWPYIYISIFFSKLNCQNYFSLNS